MIVMKFGGSSVANAQRIRAVGDIIQTRLPEEPIIVFSAFGKTTDQLLEAGNRALQGFVEMDSVVTNHQTIASELGVNHAEINPLLDELKRLVTGISLIRELSPKTKDYLVSFGERLSVRMITAYLKQEGILATYLDAGDAGMKTDEAFGNATILPSAPVELRKNLSSARENGKKTLIVTGFIGKDAQGNITTLGRGGSDLTASVIGSAMDVSRIEIWKDVDGLLSTDPRVAKNAIGISEISFEEASELAYFGAKIFHPRSILPAMQKNIPVVVKNSYNPTHPGTTILNQTKKPHHGLRAIGFKKNVVLVDIVSSRMLGQFGYLAKVFEVFNELEISVDLIATSEVSISLTVDSEKNVEKLAQALAEFAEVKIARNKASVSLICKSSESLEMLEQAFDTLKTVGIAPQMISHGASKVNTGFVIEGNELETCVQALHHVFFEKGGNA